MEKHPSFLLSQQRRRFLKVSAAAAGALVLKKAAFSSDALASQIHAVGGPITDVVLDLNHVHKWNKSVGDTWDPFWADDDNLYAVNCDGPGFGKQGRNLAFNELRGQQLDKLIGRMVNTMDPYGGATQRGPDGATWKACGQECIDGVFYFVVSRNTYGGASPVKLNRQTAMNASLIKSTDRGRTWTRSEAENYAKPMWPGRRFATPFFVHYGKNGGNVTKDMADQYVYAVSNDGFWCDGDNYILGRVERKKLPDLNAADWQYFTGGDGMLAANWTADMNKAAMILQKPTQCGQTPPCYIPSLGVYLMVLWYNPQRLKSFYAPSQVNYDFYQAEHPWGPWKFITSHNDKFMVGAHMYGPSLCAKFQQRQGSDVRVAMFTSGCPFQSDPAAVYKIWTIPLVLKTKPIPKSVMVNDNDPAIHYSNGWTYSTKRNFNDYDNDVHFNRVLGASLEFSFTGTGIDYIAEKYTDMGMVDIHLDDGAPQRVNMQLNNFPRFSQVTAYSAHHLAAGKHKIKIVNKSKAYAMLDAFRVYT